MFPEFHVRRYRPTDAGAVWAVHEAAVRDALPAFDPVADADLHHVEETYFPEGEFLVGEVPAGLWTARGPSPSDQQGSTRIVATGGVLPVGGWTAELTGLRVDPSYQCRGFGRRLTEALERAARRRGFRRVVIDTSEPLAARRLCESLDYEEYRQGPLRPGAAPVRCYTKAL
ncbi:GNAT family N-acetyltransferase [Halomarina litorea]|uniref:GNAT family N-acetyltransferase n=1 Tax=Halomarina litorea TaxID=2961595 RepID=UPI0020C5A4E4|nr:GNAT family N-acetyltransferase [Halomarina sp. BCD28]